jgi:chemotaxis protein MotB
MIKKKRQPDPPSVDLLPVMTVSLFLILLTFFILLNSIAVIDEKRVRSALGSIMGAFGSYTGGYSATKSGDMLIPPGAPMEDQETDFVKVLNLEQKQVADHVELIYQGGNQQISIHSSFLFAPDSVVLQAEAKALLTRLAGLIHSGSYPVEIIGHTGQMPAADKKEVSGWERSSRMATAVYAYLKTAGGISDERLHAYGAGAYRPRHPTSTLASRALNDRVEITLYTQALVDTRRIMKKKPPNIFTFDTFDFKIFD